jgi:hypothetical protein
MENNQISELKLTDPVTGRELGDHADDLVARAHGIRRAWR